MNSHRITILIGLVAGAMAALPAPVLANPLLSGYGGPGEGDQAILGSALVNGPRGGGGGGGGAGAGTSASSTASGESTTAPTRSQAGSRSSSAPAGKDGAPAGRSGGSSSGRAASGRGGAPRVIPGRAARGAAGASASAQRFYPAAERVPAGTQAGALGLSGNDGLLIALAIGALALVAGLTRRLTPTAAAGREP